MVVQSIHMSCLVGLRSPSIVYFDAAVYMYWNTVSLCTATKLALKCIELVTLTSVVWHT